MRLFLTLLLGYLGLATTSTDASAAESARVETALLAGGCFWCIESDFAHLDGVIDVVSGYAGGDRPNPTYENYYVTDETYKTPHIEVIKVTYDPDKLSFSDVVKYHFENIDPTDGDGQFGDRGAQYRPAVFYGTPDEKTAVEEISRIAEEKIGKPVKVDILPMAKFYAAEDYHQDYADKNPVRYKFFRYRSGRDQTVDEVWNGTDK